MRVVLYFILLLSPYQFILAADTSSSQALADDVWIYPKPFGQGRPVKVEKGEKIKIVPDEYKDWYQVLYRDSAGKKKKGFLRKTSLETSDHGNDCKNKKSTRNCWAPFLGGVLSMGYQGQREVQTTNDTIYDISEFMGFAGFFEFGTLIPMNKIWSLRLGMTLRELHMTGDAEVRDAPAGSGTEFELTEKFIGAQLGLRMAMDGFGRWGLNALMEYDKATSVDLRVVDGAAIDQSDVELPVHLFLLGGFDYEMPVGKFIFTPMIRGGGSPTAEPAILILESSLQLMRTF